MSFLARARARISEVKHACCDQANWYLTRIGCSSKSKSAEQWYLNADRICIDIIYCPWCGMRLTSAPDEGDEYVFSPVSLRQLR